MHKYDKILQDKVRIACQIEKHHSFVGNYRQYYWLAPLVLQLPVQQVFILVVKLARVQPGTQHMLLVR
jgi:hypothetical protein